MSEADYYPESDEHTALAVIPDNPDWEVMPTDSVQSGASVALRDSTSRTLATDPYVGVAAMPFDEKAQQALALFEKVPPEWIDIRPEGLIYLSHMKARHILNLAFGYGGWAIVPVGEFIKEEKGNHVILYREYRLYVNGRYVGETMAAGDYWTNNASQNYADAAEACQSYALNRLAKNFGIASQCWDKAYGDDWKRKYAETYTKDGKTLWRKKQTQLGAAGADHSNTEKGSRVSLHDTEAPCEKSAAEPVLAQSSAAQNDSILITPLTFGKIWAQGAFVNDDNGAQWTFPHKLIDTAENAMISQKQLRITFKQSGKWRNVQTAEIV